MDSGIFRNAPSGTPLSVPPPASDPRRGDRRAPRGGSARGAGDRPRPQRSQEGRYPEWASAADDQFRLPGPQVAPPQRRRSRSRTPPPRSRAASTVSPRDPRIADRRMSSGRLELALGRRATELQYPLRLTSGAAQDARASSPTLGPAGDRAPRTRSADGRPSVAAPRPPRLSSRSLEPRLDTSRDSRGEERRSSASQRANPYADPEEAALYRQVLHEEMQARAREEIREREGRPFTQPY